MSELMWDGKRVALERIALLPVCHPYLTVRCPILACLYIGASSARQRGA